MAHMLAIVDMAGGAPAINPETTPYVGHVLIWQAGNFGLYLFGGTAAQLTALNALATCRGLVGMSSGGAVYWGELDNVITSAHRTKLNTWLTARGYPTIPVDWSYRQVVRAIIRRLRSFGDDTDDFADSILMGTWVKDV
jgi:hypothetical protein